MCQLSAMSMCCERLSVGRKVDNAIFPLFVEGVCTARAVDQVPVRSVSMGKLDIWLLIVWGTTYSSGPRRSQVKMGYGLLGCPNLRGNTNHQTEHSGPFFVRGSNTERTAEACHSNDLHLASHWGLSGWVGLLGGKYSVGGRARVVLLI